MDKAGRSLSRIPTVSWIVHAGLLTGSILHTGLAADAAPGLAIFLAAFQQALHPLTSSMSSGALPDAGGDPPAPRGKKGAGGSALPPGTAPDPAAQGVYVNTPRIKRRPSAPTGCPCPIRTRCSCGSLPGGRPVGQPDPVGLRVRRWQAARQKAAYPPAAPLQHTTRSRRIPAAPSPAFPRGENFSRLGRAAVSSGQVKTFLTRGEGPQGTPCDA